MLQVSFNILLLSCQAKTKGCQSRVDIGVKYADKQERSFDEEKMKAGQCVIGLQVSQCRIFDLHQPPLRRRFSPFGLFGGFFNLNEAPVQVRECSAAAGCGRLTIE